MRSRSAQGPRSGREGINDGLVILFDLDESLCYGQIQLYAGAGYAAEHLSSAERQLLFAGKQVTVYDTAEDRGDYVNYLYVHDDIAWAFATFAEDAAVVLDALPGS